MAFSFFKNRKSSKIKTLQGSSGVTQKKVALLAVAKDEGPYITDWVAHHLYFGFSEILIGVNRTTDLTNEILKKISRKYPQVKAESVDWVDLASTGRNSQIQSISYAYLCQKVSADITDIMILDIDEFWFPTDFKTEIGRFLDKFDYDVMSFNWMLQFGEEKPFSKPFETKDIQYNPHIKSVFRKQILPIVDYVGMHVPTVAWKERNAIKHVFSNGDDHSPKLGAVTDGSFNIRNKRAYILHRMCRSEDEYLALLLRGRPGKGGRIKDNRIGFRYQKKESLALIVAEKYVNYIEAFPGRVNVLQEVISEQSRRVKLAKDIFNVDISFIEKDIEIYEKVLRGTKALEKLYSKLSGECKDVDLLEGAAKKIQKQHPLLSTSLMEAAQNIHSLVD